MKHSGRLIFITGSGLFLFILMSLLMMSDALQNSDRFSELYSGLLLFNAIGLFVLIILIGINFRRLAGELRHRVPGSRIRLRMVAIFTVLSVTPVLILYYFSLDFLQRGIDSWFDLRVEQSLDDSLELSQIAFDLRKKDLALQTTQIALDFADLNDAVIPFEIDDYRLKSGAEELTVMTRQGTIIASSVSDMSRLVPDRPSDTILFQVQQGNNHIGLDTVSGKGLSVRVVVNLPRSGIDNERRILQALYPIPERMNMLAEQVQTSYVKYKELTYLREQLKRGFALVLTLVLLFSIFSIVWTAFYSAGRLMAPIRDLAAGTQSVAAGDYSTQLPVPGHDELGFLVASFNEMTRRISQARDEVRTSQQALEAQRTYLEAVLVRLSSGVLVLDEQRCIRTANISCRRILGVDPQLLIGRSLAELRLEYQYLDQFLQLIESRLETRASDWREQVTLFGGGGREILMCNGTSLTLSEDQTLVYVVVFDDITALIQGQRDAAWGEMARRLAHEIKNPLTPIQLAAERLRHKYHNKLDLEEFVILNRLTNTIIQQVKTMKDMVNAFQEYAKPPVMRLENVNLNELLREVVDLFSNLDSRAEINMQLDDRLPMIQADPGRLRQVFNNILNNAFDAGAPIGRTSLEITTSYVRETGVDCIEIRILDSGPGITEDIISTIFEPYVTTKKKGTGLGLAIVKKIIEEHGGLVMCRTTPDRPGACAIIRLPVTGEASQHSESRLRQEAI